MLAAGSGHRPSIDTDWQRLLQESAVDPETLAEQLPIDDRALIPVVRHYPMRINPYYLSLISSPGDPIGRQAVPSIEEIQDSSLIPDPSGEDDQSPTPCVVHRYPDRVLFMVSRRCPVYCRFCLRKRLTGGDSDVNEAEFREGLAYIRETRTIEEVILSGGDPLMLADDRLAEILNQLRAIAHVQVIRIHSRMPCTLPQRITPRLVALLSRFHPLFLVTHFNHPRELTPQAARACAGILDAGIPLSCQTVLLKGVNDDPTVMTALMKGLVRMRVRPYYLHHPDPVQGTEHFRTPLKTGQDILRHLRGRISGLCVPQYMVDLPDGGGKVAVLPDSIKRLDENRLEIKNYQGERFLYTDV